MPCRDVVVSAVDAPLELEEVVLHLVGASAVEDVLTETVVHREVPGHFFTNGLVSARGVRVKDRSALGQTVR